MSTVIRASNHELAAAGVAFNFDDMRAQANAYLGKVRAEAVKIVAQAQQDAAAVRRRAEIEGRQAAVEAATRTVQNEMQVILPALRQAVADIQQAKQAWLKHWEAGAVHVAAAIGGRLARRELTPHPEIPLALVREALELAAGSSQIKLHLHPDDRQVLGAQIEMLVKEISGLGSVEVVADPQVSRGGCRVETRFGTIDQQFEAQMARIEEELTA